MTIANRQSPVRGAFVGNELLIVLGLLGVAVLGAVALARALHLGWLASAAVILGSGIIVALGLSFAFTPRKPR